MIGRPAPKPHSRSPEHVQAAAHPIAAATYDLAVTTVTVRTDHPPLLDELTDYYRTTTRPGGYRIDARLRRPPDESRADRYGVTYDVAPGGAGRPGIRVVCPAPARLATAVRKTVRDAMTDWLDRRRYAMFHAAAVHRDGLLVILAGDAGAGKTTLALDAVLRHGFHFISNDHLIVYADPAGPNLAITSLPTRIPLKIRTCLDYEAALPEPNRTSTQPSLRARLDPYRTLPTDQVNAITTRVDFLYSTFRQPNPVTLDIHPAGTPKTAIVFPEFGPQWHTDPIPTSDAATALAAHLRTDWVFDADCTPNHFASPKRTIHQFTDDGRDLAQHLAENATALQMKHQGTLDRLLCSL
ncbi:hypothetical protein [Actinomadura atramentaria]|uniref:hypothetical protein n=1 Tax=Actinomadura atramentaria TaxID=1990 RepID=UPI00037374A3|nr:hypothetical protein [Actinomadura atramentaria]